MVFCTINEFPAYENLSGYSVKGHYACPIYEKNTSFFPAKIWKDDSIYQAPKISQTLSSISAIEENFLWKSGK